MAVRIRLARRGDKKSPFYRLVVANSESPRDGKFIERIGTYGPKQTPHAVQVDEQKLAAWLQKGAKPTDTVRSLLISGGLLKK
ncbi:MAG: 30S ribosomal protein S16 [Deltaproteobacteria bacterium]|nr:30S ribosomal protein S16 [Deltaproteobacteria bacterium]